MVHNLAATAMAERSSANASGDLVGRLVGFILVAVVPTLFWSALLWLVTSAYGQPISLLAISAVALSIMGLLGCVWASFAMGDRGVSTDD